jgi:methylated-DNA-protein-cysteine methyltransferase-like protein
MKIEITPMSLFTRKVIQAVYSIPSGHVVSYGQVASLIGAPRAARQVGRTLYQLGRRDGLLLPQNSLTADSRQLTTEFPWWRVVNNAGRISIKGQGPDAPLMQKQKLEAEGLTINHDFTFNIEQYRYHPTPEDIKNLQLNDHYLDTLHLSIN